MQTPPAQPVPVAKALAAAMPRSMARGCAAIRPHWMAVRDPQITLAIPSASCGPPCVPQPGAVGYLMSSPSPQMPQHAPQPVETRIFRAAPSGCGMEYRGTVQGHVDLPDAVCSDNSQHQLEDAVKLSSIVCRSISSACDACYPALRCAENTTGAPATE